MMHENNSRLITALVVVADHINERNENNDSNAKKVRSEDLYVVWFSKTLRNWKALVSNDIEEGRYYEVTYNGDRDEIYIDDYIKSVNVCVDKDGNKTKKHY